jgi:hypothetical protein
MAIEKIRWNKILSHISSFMHAGCNKISLKLCFAQIAFLMLLSSSIFAAPSEFSWSDTDQLAQLRIHFQAPTKSTPAGDWFRITFLAILICLFANAAIFMFAKAMHSTSAERFAVSEFYQVSASAIIVFIIVAAMSQAFELLNAFPILPYGTTSLCMGNEVDVWKLGPPAVIQCHLQEKITYVEGLFAQAVDINKKVEPLTSLCIFVWGVQAYCGDWDNALHAEMESAHLLANKVVPIAIGLHAQYSFITYIARNMLSVFLPLGILLRIFPGIRGIGALLIAISIGFFFVFPISYLLLDPATSRPNPQELLPSFSDQFPRCFNTFSGSVSMITQLHSVAQKFSAAPDASELGQEIAKLYIEAFLIPLVSLAITLLFIHNAAILLGGDSGEIMHFVAKVM